MRFRALILATLVFLSFPVGGGATRAPRTDDAVTIHGWIRIVSAESGQVSVVTASSGVPQGPGADVVDIAFRLQHATPAHLDFEGPGVVTRDANRIVISADDHTAGWTFVVVGRPTGDAKAPSNYPVFPLVGLSRHSGASVQRTRDQVVAQLLAGKCLGANSGGAVTAGAGGSACDACANDEEQNPSCGVTCGDSSCSAECTNGYHGCCSCGGGCGCCPDRIDARPASHH
jgi:hypothetical protein